MAFVQNNEIYHYHTDHLGTPQDITNAKGNIVWSANYRAYGNLALANVEEVENNLRFQGQYYDEESGLHYNRFRYYDPNCGRFINQDPIGLEGGTNNYQYVPNPISWIDPLGLSCKDCPDADEGAVKGTDSELSRNGAFKEAKEKAGVPRSQQPDRVYKEKIRDQQGHVEGRVYEFKKQDGSTATIREHSLGHKLDNHGPHFNSKVRSPAKIKQPLGGNGDSHTYFN